MSQQELLTDVIQTLQGLGIEFMLSGSHASSLQGEARATHDIDLPPALLEKVKSILPADYDAKSVEIIFRGKARHAR